MALESPRSAGLLAAANRLLANVGIRDTAPFASVAELRDNASSLFVAVFEQLFSTRVEGVLRKPAAHADYAFNAQRVIDSLRAVLPPRVVCPSAVHGESVAAGDLPTIAFLVGIFADIHRVISPRASTASSGTASGGSNDESAIIGSGSGSGGRGSGGGFGEGGLEAAGGDGAPDSSSGSRRVGDAYVDTDSREADPLRLRAQLQESDLELDTSMRAFEDAAAEAEAEAAEAASAAAAAAVAAAASTSALSGDDIWSGVSPQRVRSQAIRAGLGVSQSLLPAAQLALSPPLPPPMTAFMATVAEGGAARPARRRQASASPRPLNHRPFIVPLLNPVRPIGPPSPRRPAPAKVALASQSSGSATLRRHGAAAPPPLPGLAPGPSDLDGEPLKSESHVAAPPASPSETARLAAAQKVADRERTDQEDRQAASDRATLRRQAGLTERLARAGAEEGQAISRMVQLALKEREAEFRMTEGRVLRAALQRARAAKHERKVLALRTRHTIEDLARTTLSLRIARSSKQAAATSALLRAVASQERLAAADTLKAEAEERAVELAAAKGRVQWAASGAAALEAVVLEEVQKQVSQRQAAAESQRQALSRAVREMRVDEAAMLARLREQMVHAEEAFLAQHVEPMAVGAELPPFAPQVARERAADATDTDVSAQRVQTVRAVTRQLGAGAASRRREIAGADRAIKRAADDASAAVHLAESFERSGKALALAPAKAPAKAGTN